jgi:hypothetical protein
VTLIVRFSTERQKLVSATQLPFSHWLWTYTDPLMTTSLGDSPRPETSV